MLRDLFMSTGAVLSEYLLIHLEPVERLIVIGGVMLAFGAPT